MLSAFRNNNRFMFRCAAWLALAVSPLVAQTDRGAVTGIVFDTSGSLIPNAKITLTNAATGFQSGTVTTNTGNYTLAALQAGAYSMQVEAPSAATSHGNKLIDRRKVMTGRKKPPRSQNTGSFARVGGSEHQNRNSAGD